MPILLVFLFPFYLIFFIIGIICTLVDNYNRKCFICEIKDNKLKSINIYKMGHYELFWYHNLCIDKAKRNKINYDSYILKIIELVGIENGG